MRFTLIGLALSACELTTTSDSDTGTTTPFDLDATGQWTGTCTGKYLGEPLSLNADLSLTEATGEISGQADIEAALGMTGASTTVSAAV